MDSSSNAVPRRIPHVPHHNRAAVMRMVSEWDDPACSRMVGTGSGAFRARDSANADSGALGVGGDLVGEPVPSDVLLDLRRVEAQEPAGAVVRCGVALRQVDGPDRNLTAPCKLGGGQQVGRACIGRGSGLGDC